ncbi:hypothetical protein AAFN90_11990 [Erwiniaceae bacterium CAU 1747]
MSLFKLIIAFVLGAGATYLGYVKWTTKVDIQHTVCIVDATHLALDESERTRLQALGQSSEPVSDDTRPLKGFNECQRKVDPNISDLEFAKKMVKRSISEQQK